MRYDGRKLTAPVGEREIVAVWDYTSRDGYTGRSRWLCKATSGQLYIYHCIGVCTKPEGTWRAVNSSTWSALANDVLPVWWSCSNNSLATAQVDKCVCDLHQLMRGDGHNADCPEKPNR